MKNIIAIAFVTLLSVAVAQADDTAHRTVRDNTGGANARVTFHASVNRPLKIETVNNSSFEVDLGAINPSETKTLGVQYGCVLHVSGMPNFNFSISLNSQTSSNANVVINGFEWKTSQTSPNDNWNSVSEPPFTAQLNTEGHCWVQVCPISMTALPVATQTERVTFTYSFNCSYQGI